jgi:hypothetical protein
VPYINCPKLSQASKRHLQSFVSPLQERLNLGFLTEGKLAAIFIKTFSWSFSTGRSLNTSQQDFWHNHHCAIRIYGFALDKHVDRTRDSEQSIMTQG